MAETILPSVEISSQSSPHSLIVRRLVWKIAAATWLLMAIGSATRVMNAGLACPDWPLCYGQLVPRQQMNLQVFLEWFHRLDAALIGVSTLVLLGLSWWWRNSLPKWLPWLALLATILIGCQGLLGALTVTELLRFDIVTAHLGTALLFFSLLVTIACQLSPTAGNSDSSPLRYWSLAATIVAYVQSLLGGLVASQWALHQCFGSGEKCVELSSHLIGIVPTTIAILGTIFYLWRINGDNSTIGKLKYAIPALLICQIAIGFATYKMHLQVEILTVCHQAVGALLLGSLVVCTNISLAKISLIKYQFNRQMSEETV